MMIDLKFNFLKDINISFKIISIYFPLLTITLLLFLISMIGNQINGDVFFISKNIYYLLSVISILLFIQKDIKFRNKLFVAYFFIMFLYIFVSNNKLYSLYSFYMQFSLFLIVTIFLNYISLKNYYKIKRYFFVISLLLVFIVSVNYFYINNHNAYISSGRFKGIIYGVNALGILSVYSILVAIFLFNISNGKLFKLFILLTIFSSFVIMILTGSRSAFLSFIFGISIWIIYKFSYKQVLSLIFITILVVFYIVTNTNFLNDLYLLNSFLELHSIRDSSRGIIFDHIDLALQVIKGFGYGTGEYYYENNLKELQIDNSYLGIWLSLGWIGLIILVLLCINSFRKYIFLLKKYKNNSILIFSLSLLMANLVKMLFSNIMFSYCSFFTFILFLNLLFPFYYESIINKKEIKCN